MRKYETVIVIRPDLSEENTQSVIDSTANVISSNGGTIIHQEVWGKKRLAYTVKKYTDGIYVQLNFESEGDLISRLDNYYVLSEDIIRNITLRNDDFVVPVVEEPAEETVEGSAETTAEPVEATAVPVVEAAEPVAEAAEPVAEEAKTEGAAEEAVEAEATEETD